MPTATEVEYKSVYGKWHSILSNMTNPLVFSQSPPAYFAEAANLTDWYTVMDWVPQYGQLARHSRDTLVLNSTLYWPDITGWDSIMFNYGQEVRLARYQKPGYYNDPDFLIVDHFNLSLDEKKSHFTIWSVLSAPLIISAWIPGFSAEEFEYLTNKDIIAVNQDPLALQSTLVSQDGTWDILTKNLANGDRPLAVINRSNFSANHNISLQKVGLLDASEVLVKYLWTGDSSVAAKQITAANVPSHGTAVFRISSSEKSFGDITPTGMIFNTYSLTVLTLTSEGLNWANSTGKYYQVWHTMSDSTIRALVDPSKCLTDSGQGNIQISTCTRSLTTGQLWNYLYSGNVISQSSSGCLTESNLEEVITSECLYEDNTQVFGLPSGVEILEVP